MAIQVGQVSHPHWNYLIVLEQDLLKASRYVEFADGNFETYSIEFAHLLFAAAAETEVVLKTLCALFAPGVKVENIDQYRDALLPVLTNLSKSKVSVPRFRLELQPWNNWAAAPVKNPDWWRGYNAVKHERHTSFKQATLKNALNAVAALYIVTLELANRYDPTNPGAIVGTPTAVAAMMEPASQLFVPAGYAP